MVLSQKNVMARADTKDERIAHALAHHNMSLHSKDPHIVQTVQFHISSSTSLFFLKLKRDYLVRKLELISAALERVRKKTIRRHAKIEKNIDEILFLCEVAGSSVFLSNLDFYSAPPHQNFLLSETVMQQLTHRISRILQKQGALLFQSRALIFFVVDPTVNKPIDDSGDDDDDVSLAAC